jgi:hypothetical protein
MKDTSMTTSSRLPAVAHLALDVADRGQSTMIAVLHDARSELRSAVDSTIELAEKLATGAFRFARKLTQRVDESAAQGLSGLERTLGDAVKQARETASARANANGTATPSAMA